MKTILIPVLSLGVLTGWGCADGSTAKRDDSRYVTLPANRVPTAPTAVTVPRNLDEIHRLNLPGETGRQLAADKATASAVVTGISPVQQKQQDDQDRFEQDLAKLDPK